MKGEGRAGGIRGDESLLGRGRKGEREKESSEREKEA